MKASFHNATLLKYATEYFLLHYVYFYLAIFTNH